MPACGARSQQVGRDPASDRADDLRLRHSGERDTLDVVDRDRIERNVELACPLDDRVRVRDYGGLVECVDDGGVSGATGQFNLVSHLLHPREPPSGEKHRGPFPGERPCDGRTDRSGSSVNHCRLLLQQHEYLRPGVPIQTNQTAKTHRRSATPLLVDRIEAEGAGDRHSGAISQMQI